MKKYIIFLIVLIILTGCNFKKVELEERYGYQLVISGDHKLATKTIGKGKAKVTVLFESGLGMSCDTWITSGIIKNIENEVKIILYNRAGISSSDRSNDNASIENMIKDLDAVITTLADGDQLILVGHSLGGAIIRAYTMKFPEKVSGLVFVDTTHELSLNDLKQDDIVEELSERGVSKNHPEYKEIIEIMNTLIYLDSLGNLPDIPTVALTAMNNGSPDVSLDSWVEAHQSLGKGISDFKHIKVDSGHFIQNSHPEIITSSILDIVNKI